MAQYLENRQGLTKVILLVDIRRAPSEQDIKMSEYIRHYGYNGIVVATKADKVSRNEMQKLLAVIRKDLGLLEDEIIIPVSTLKRTGYDLLLEEMDKLIVK